MSKIERYAGNLRAFGSNAQGLERTLFGETTQADDLTSQVTAAFLRGWGIVGPSENPSLEDFNAAMYAMSQFIAYQHQMGIPEWDAAQEYYKGSLCVRGGETYSSLDDNNIGSAPPSAKWTQLLSAKNSLSEITSAGPTAVAEALSNLGLTYTSSLTAPGWYKFPGGLIIQWFSGPGLAANGSQVVTYPIPFPSTMLGIACTPGATAPGGGTYGIQSIDPASCRIWNQSTTQAAQAGSIIALGK